MTFWQICWKTWTKATVISDYPNSNKIKAHNCSFHWQTDQDYVALPSLTCIWNVPLLNLHEATSHPGSSVPPHKFQGGTFKQVKTTFLQIMGLSTRYTQILENNFKHANMLHIQSVRFAQILVNIFQGKTCLIFQKIWKVRWESYKMLLLVKIIVQKMKSSPNEMERSVLGWEFME